MIIDCHTHIWPDRASLAGVQGFSCLGGDDSRPAQPEHHLAAAEPAYSSFVLGFVSRHLRTEIPNSFIRNYVTGHVHRLISFAGVDPTDPGASQQLERLHEQGFSGITLSPACQAVHPADTRAMKVYKSAAELNMPIYFLNGMALPGGAWLEFAQPAMLDEVARAYPELPMVISHLGYPWVEQTIALLAKHPRVYADVAGLTPRPWLAYRSLTLAYESGVIEKLLFASDFPCHTVKSAVEALYNLNKITLNSVLPAVPRECLRGIVERNSLELLGLEQAVAGEAGPSPTELHQAADSPE